MCQMGEMPLNAEFVYGWGPCGDGEARRLFAGLRGLDEVGGGDDCLPCQHLRRAEV